MKVGFVVPKLSGGGAEYVAREWAAHLDDADVEVVIIVTDSDEFSVGRDVRVIKLPAHGFVKRIISLRKLITDENFDVVVGLMPYWNLLVLGATKIGSRSATKAFISSHTIESKYGVDRGWKFGIQMLFARFAYAHADAFLASSHPVAAEAVAKFGAHRDRLWVVPNPVFPVEVTATGRHYRPAGTLPSTLVVPGRLVDQKRPHVAVQVAKLLSIDGGPAPRIIFVGQGPAADSVTEAARLADVSVSLPGWRDDWTEIVPEDSVVLLPSLLEGFGNVLLNATASGLPVIASSKALGVADAIIPGVTGVLVAGDGPEDYAEGIRSLNMDEPVDPTTVSRWLNGFTRQESGDRLLTIISSVLGAKQC